MPPAFRAGPEENMGKDGNHGDFGLEEPKA